MQELYVWAPPSESGGIATPSPVPEGIDYNLWLGPAKHTPYCEDRVFGEGPRKGIYHISDYAIGFIAGWGAHPVDQLQWWADQVDLGIPVKYKGTGTIPTEGLFDTVTHWDVECTYANGLKMRFLDNDTARSVGDIPHIEEIKFSHCALFIGTKGWVAVSRGAWQVFPNSLLVDRKFNC